jgi:multicomponent K+:H+ antiporter subunit D
MTATADQWIIAPILLPAMVAAFLILALRHTLIGQRFVSLATLAAVALIALANLAAVADGAVLPYRLGDWPQPFGINLVLDRLSATMVLLTSVLALLVGAYACTGWDRQGRHFHPLLLFQVMGINGAFLTGDVFNLFVFFEVMLIASYGLMLHGGGPRRLVAGFHYVAINLVGSTLFLFAVGLIYAVTGTLNMADLAVKVPLAASGDTALLAAGALMLMLVFCLKAAMVPLHGWLPTAYAAASPPAAAMFMVMTKVGAYALIRFHTLTFGPGTGPLAGLGQAWIMPAALATLALGAMGVLGSRSLSGLICFAVVWSMGSLLVTLGLFDQKGLSASIYYMLHSTLAGAALFLLLDLLRETRGGIFADRLTASPAFARQGWLGVLFFIAAVAMAGLPPLSGFVGKVLILDATVATPLVAWIWSTVLVSSLVVIFGLARAGSVLFWKSGGTGAPAIELSPEAGAGIRLAVVGALLAATVLLSVFAGPVTRLTAATAGDLLASQRYIDAVLSPRPSANAKAAP